MIEKFFDSQFRIQNAECRIIVPAGTRRFFDAAFGLAQNDIGRKPGQKGGWKTTTTNMIRQMIYLGKEKEFGFLWEVRK